MLIDIKKVKSRQKLTGASDPLEKLIHSYLDDFIASNHSAKVLTDGLRVIGIGLRPALDHLGFWTLDIESRAKEFLKCGYAYDRLTGVIKYGSDWSKVYRKVGYPALYFRQPFRDVHGKESVILEWVKRFTERPLRHIAFQVDDIETAVFYLEKQGIAFTGNILGDHGSDLRQIETRPEIKKNKAFSVVRLVERHRGTAGFLPS